MEAAHETLPAGHASPKKVRERQCSSPNVPRTRSSSRDTFGFIALNVSMYTIPASVPVVNINLEKFGLRLPVSGTY